MDDHGRQGRPADTDGRLARTQRTRAAIVDALVDLLREGEVEPGAARIAERAGISKRTIFVHYASLDDLHRDLAQRGTAMVLDLLWVIDPDLPLDDRLDAICEQRAKVHEAIGPLRRAASRRAATSTTAAESQRFARRASREQVARVFARELDGLDRAERRRRASAIEAVLSGESWDLWRDDHGLDLLEAQQTMRTALERLLS